MQKILAHALLTDDGWHRDIVLSHNNSKITGLENDSGGQTYDCTVDVLVAGMPNLHSHAFQRAMAGFAERRGATPDSFWSWRKEMYRLALSMTPQQVEAVAARLYMEMLEAGFTRVGEFHYLHHDENGKPYADIGEMAGRIAAAAAQTGINLTLLPVFYAHAGFGGKPADDGQKRFINTAENFARLLESCQMHLAPLANAVLGLAPHSLRAVTQQELADILPLAKQAPVHIHIAEQNKEVEDCIAATGQRPVEWLLDHAPVDERWCLIHATHMTETETIRMAKSGAVAGLCPITEANLGDGIFNALPYLAHNGAYGIGSDSNICIAVNEELRQFEYSVRLNTQMRNAVARPGSSNGRILFDGALAGGAQALGADSPLAVGSSADFVALNLQEQDWIKQDAILDSWIFTGNIAVDSVWVAGRQVVHNGRHKARDTINKHFATAMRQLFAS